MSRLFRTGRPSTVVMMSPGTTPARDAGEPGCTDVTLKSVVHAATDGPKCGCFAASLTLRACHGLIRARSRFAMAAKDIYDPDRGAKVILRESLTRRSKNVVMRKYVIARSPHRPSRRNLPFQPAPERGGETVLRT